MSNRIRGVVLIAAGALVAVVSLAADPLGFGAHPGIGWKQIVGALAGIAAAGVGAVDLRR